MAERKRCSQCNGGKERQLQRVMVWVWVWGKELVEVRVQERGRGREGGRRLRKYLYAGH
jgi:hypothetical protein